MAGATANDGRVRAAQDPRGGAPPASSAGLDERILGVLEELTAKQQRLARVLLDNKVTLAFASADELGRRAGVDPATVVRFSRRLGYAGFSDLRQAVRDSLPQFLTALDKARRSLEAHEEAGSVVASVFGREMANIEETAQLCDGAALDTAIAAISQAERIFVLGFGVEAPVADLLVHHLMHVGVAAHRAPASVNDAAIDIASVTPRDLVITVAVWRYLRNTYDLTLAARRLGATTIALTDSAASPVAPHADVVLVAATHSPELSISVAGLVALASALATGVALAHPQRTLSTLAKVDELYAELGLLIDPRRRGR
jgi:DNA-binding MurR/RpiR family transcriptional regulator